MAEAAEEVAEAAASELAISRACYIDTPLGGGYSSLRGGGTFIKGLRVFTSMLDVAGTEAPFHRADLQYYSVLRHRGTQQHRS